MKVDIDQADYYCSFKRYCTLTQHYRYVLKPVRVLELSMYNSFTFEQD